MEQAIQLLDEYIAKSGLKVDFIIKKLGISHNAFYKKRNGVTKWRAAEIYVICHLLDIQSNEDKDIIFFNKKVEV